MIALFSTIIIALLMVVYAKYTAIKKQDEEIKKYQQEKKKYSTIVGAVKKQSCFLELIGIAFPRIDGINEIEALEQLVFYFRHVDYDYKFLMLSATNNNDNVYYEIQDSELVTLIPKADKREQSVFPKNDLVEKKFLSKTIPETFQSYNFSEIIPSPVPEKYHFLFLMKEIHQQPHFISKNITYCIGRENFQTNSGENLISLKEPDSKNMIVKLSFKNSAEDIVGIGVLGLSRKHLKAQLVEDKLSIQMYEGKTSCYILDQQFEMKEEITSENNTSGILQKEDYLLIGNYLLRFSSDK